MGRRSVMGARGGLPALGLAAKLGKRFIPKLARGAKSLGKRAVRMVRRSGPEIATIGVGTAVATGTTRAIARRMEGVRKKYRRMNPMNFKALNRAVRRIDAAEKMFRKVLRIRTPEKASRSIVPKSKRR